MTYSTGGLIQASDFNNIVGPYSTPNTTNTVNAIWGTGFNNKGYGQPQLANVDENELISSDDWYSLIKTMNTIAYRQNSTITTYTPPAENDTIEYLSALVANKNKIYDNVNDARQQGTTYSSTLSISNVWSSAAVFNHIITFESGDKARYFFNSGGQIAITLSHSTGPNVNQMWNKLAQDTGTIVLSASLPRTSNQIAGTSYTGITRVGGTGEATVNTNYGYYSLTQSYVEVFRKQAFAVFSNYLQSYVSINVKSNGTQGTNGDRGSVISIQTIWDEIPNGTPCTADTQVTVTLRYPSTSIVTTDYVPFVNTWGTAYISGTAYAD